MKKKHFILLIFIIQAITINAQSFAPQVGFAGSTAIYKDSSIFIDWATDIDINRSYQNIIYPENGLVSFGTNSLALGKADGIANVVSLGDGGNAVLSFSSPIVNGEGYDFAVFENGFLQEENSYFAFLEFAYVSVSTNGEEYIRFPSVSEISFETQTNIFGNSDASYVHNLAGKYIANYGTPFNLDEIKDLAKGTTVDLNNINYIKLTDVIGTISSENCSYDSEGNIINDPYPTSFPSGGFDLDAVGVINNKINTENINNNNVFLYPNPAFNIISFYSSKNIITTYEIYSVSGNLIEQNFDIKNNAIIINNLEKGMYFVKFYSEGHISTSKFIKH